MRKIINEKLCCICIFIILECHPGSSVANSASIDNVIRNTFQYLENIRNNSMMQNQEIHQHTKPNTSTIITYESNSIHRLTNDTDMICDQNFNQEQHIFNQYLSDCIAKNVIDFGLNLANQISDLRANSFSAQSEIFSPLSIISALLLLLMGSKGTSYQQLSALIGLKNDIALYKNHSKYHSEFALMLDEIQKQNFSRRAGLMWKRTPQNWRFTGKFNNKSKNDNNSNNSQPITSLPGIDSHYQQLTSHNVRIANGIFIQAGYTLNLNYKQIAQSLYDAEVAQLDYVRNVEAAREYINIWVQNKTLGKILNIVSGQIDQRTKVLLVNVLYFRGFWENSFFPKATKLENFYPDGLHSRSIPVYMMATGGLFPFYQSQEYDCRIIGLPYKGNEITMYVIQPNNSTRAKLREFQKNLTSQIINDLIEKMVKKTTVMVLPKMHFVRQLNLKEILKRFGLTDIFISGISNLSFVTEMKNYSEPYVKKQFPSENANTFTTTEYLDRFHEPALIFRNKLHSYNTTHTASVSIKNDEDKDEDSLESEYSDLFVEDILHKIDIVVDEHGTEAAAATLTYLHRSGTDVVFRGDTPFILLIQHDLTKLPLFYGIINKPEL